MAQVLVVEDDRRLADTIGDLLSSIGHQVKVTYDGPQALVEADACAPDTVLLDLLLPSFSGFEVARHLRETCGGSVRLVAYTAWAEIMARRMFDIGFDAVLVKPATLEMILAAIDGSDARNQ